MNWLSTVLALFQLVPLLLTTIVSVEGIFGKGNGPAKKAVVLSALATASPAVVAGASNFVDSTINSLNSAGVFSHGPEAPSAPSK